MNEERIKSILESAYSREYWTQIIHEVFGAQKVHALPPKIGLNDKLESAGDAFELGSLKTTDSQTIGFYEVEIDEHLALERNRVGLRKMLRSIYKYDVDGAVIVFRQKEKWRLSFVSEIRMRDKDGQIINFETEPKRYTYLLGKGEKCRTAIERLKFISGKRKNLRDIIEAFSVDELTKEFYSELSNWYHRAIQTVDFPGISESEALDPKNVKAHKAKSVIRLITRLVFVWFLKQRIKALNPLFEAEILDRLNRVDVNDSTYYKALLQNLFFATFNTSMNKDEPNSRRWVKEGRRDRDEFLDQRYYRYKRYFKDPENALSLFEEIPFLNGGLFDNLDYRDKLTDKAVRVDCFSTTEKNEKLLSVPDHLFWESQMVDLREAYNSSKMKDVPVNGIIKILNRYNFTLEENTPLEKEVALDPELLGKVFENLLASYNPETQTPARNQTGSFYTPRDIVNFQVDEALKAYLLEKLTGEKVTSYNEFGKSQMDAFGNQGKSGQLALVEESGISAEQKDLFRTNLNLLFDYNTTLNPFDKKQTETLVHAIDHVKIIDPANGTGAYPMGALLRMVELLKKLDPDNKGWKARQLEKIEGIEDLELRQKWREDIEAAFKNNPDYGRKLYLLEECLYGVDIQPIACQISKLRFFISLIVDQKIDFSQPNFGIKALPNLETRFVAADSLIPLEDGRFIPDEVYILKKELRKIRDAYFVAKSRETKKKRQKEDEELRQKIALELKDALFPPSAADAIAAWDPYDQNKSSDWFNADWMFGVNNDFDIVLGNPPYIQLQKDGGKLANKYEAYNYNTFARTGDIYSLFYERGIKLMQGNNGARKHGVLTYITSNKWMRAGYGAKTRNYFAKKTNPLLVIDFSNVQIFESATVDTNILLLQNNHPQPSTMACRFDTNYPRGTSLTNYIHKNSHEVEAFKADEEWVIMDLDTQRIKSLVEQQGVQLKKWNITINRGILTGLNEAFIIPKDIKNELIKADPKNAEVIKPILRGKDIQKWYPDFAEMWLIAA
ncbi:MAG: Eco57I restriction-modification methylase domain-containing protein, partial [Flavobacteriales bacterium]|nr:Eco57I restriction-modification methylase domain-containing protein [Flavobacteriales bacterium]